MSVDGIVRKNQPDEPDFPASGDGGWEPCDWLGGVLSPVISGNFL
jgi:hypothetical protein